MPGTYTLLITLDQSATVTFGAAGERDVDAGLYAYTGSAHGPGGFTRLDRHRAVACGENDTRHWHVDYFLGHPAASITTAIRTPDERIECSVARSIAAATEAHPVDGIGASDCGCNTHLTNVNAFERPVNRVRSAHGENWSGG